MRYLDNTYDLISVGIAKKLRNTFGYDVYDDEIEQNANPPCFLFTFVAGNSREYLNLRRNSMLSFDIVYFPKTKKAAEINSMGESLMNVLKFINLSDGLPLMGRNMSYQTVDGVLHFMVDYDAVVKPIPEDEEKMMILDYKQEAKNG